MEMLYYRRLGNVTSAITTGAGASEKYNTKREVEQTQVTTTVMRSILPEVLTKFLMHLK